MNELGPILGLVGVVFSLFAGAWVGLLKYTMSLKDTETARQIAEARALAVVAGVRDDNLAERLRVDEIATTRLVGELNLCTNKLTHLEADVHRLEEAHVPRAEWEKAIGNLQAQLADIQRRLSGRYPAQGSGESGGFKASR
jgi:hypothetical protein